MPDFITLSCPNCGGKLTITQDLERFACGYCGMEQVVNRGGGVISLKPVVEKLTNIQGGVDKTASELAIKRIKEEISDLDKTIESTRLHIPSNPPKEINPPNNIFEYFLIITGFILVCIAFFQQPGSETLQGIIISAILCLVFGIIGFMNKHKKQEIYEEYLKEHNAFLVDISNKKIYITKLEAEIAAKKIELVKHQKIVES